MRDADVAMYRAKADGKGRHAVFDAAMHEQVMRRLDVEGDLRQAIEQQRLEVVYQPIVQAATGRIVGFEALCRWPDGHGGQIEPADFVAIAEETGLACRSAARCCATRARSSPSGAEPRAAPGLTMGVNVSGRQLAEPDFVEMLRTILRETGLDPRALRLEVKELDLSRGRGDDATRRVLEQALEHAWCARTSTTSARALHRCGCCTASPATRSRSRPRWSPG